ncbi:hypothetical protein ACFQU1_23540 [Chelatococcus sp. GCM10030263]|uniref:hypothetical protein n=1 Tax=Chelatococcus sp. GCM10030263 TaxID=3273387 RepID=UPI0036098841
MEGNVAQLFPFRSRSRDWSNQELAEFYRVEAALVQAGLTIETDRGLSDENEPWFAFCHADTGEVIIHFARIGGVYVAASGAFEGVLRGVDFRSLVEALLMRHPLVVPRKGEKISLHPSALLVALVATAFFKLSEADAQASTIEPRNGSGQAAEPALSGRTIWVGAAEDARHAVVHLDRRQAAVMLAAITIAVTQHDLNLGSAQWLWAGHGSQLGDAALDQAQSQLVSDFLPSVRSAHPLFPNDDKGGNDPAIVLLGQAKPMPHAPILAEKLSVISLLSGLMSPLPDGEKIVPVTTEVMPKEKDKLVDVEDLSSYQPPHDEHDESSAAPSSAAPSSSPNSASASSSSSTSVTSSSSPTSATSSSPSSSSSSSEDGHASDESIDVSSDTGSTIPVILQQSTHVALPVADAVSFVESFLAGSATAKTIFHLDDGWLADLFAGELTAPVLPAADDGVVLAPATVNVAPAPEGVEDPGADITALLEELSTEQLQFEASEDGSGENYGEMLALFAERNPDFHVALSGKDALFYNPSADEADAPLGFLTWSFDDGSTVSLMGVLPQVVPATDEVLV